MLISVSLLLSKAPSAMMYSLYPSGIFIVRDSISFLANASLPIPVIRFSTLFPFSINSTVEGITRALFLRIFALPFSENPVIA